MEAKHVNEFRPNDVLWETISKGLLRNPERPLKNTNKRMVYIYNNMFFVKKDFTFGFRTVKSGEIHLIQTTNIPMLIYEFPSSSLRCRANPNLFRRSFEPYDQMLYHRMVLEPHTAYPIPAGTRYILLTVQKTVFGLDIIPETILLRLMENGFNLGDFRKMKRYDQKAYKLPPPTPAHVPAETNTRPLEEQPGSSSKRNRVFIIPVIRPPVAPVLIARPSMALATPQPVIISEPPVLTTPQILLPDRPRPLVQIPDPPVQIPVFQPPVQLVLPDPPVVETLEPTLTDDSSIDQIMSSVFGDCSQQGLPPAHTQEPQLLDTVPSLFVTTFGKTVIVFTSHLDLTWDKGVELRFFQGGRPPSHRVWKAHQPQTTDAYIFDFADCTRVADVYGKWLTWLDDWEMHRDDNVPWCMVGLQPWKRALEKHVQRSHEKALANGMPSDVTLLEHI
ncbi:uncharacterized protein TNCV_4809111 [Trichonephila clavipes]|nr:uncharacterized protein TNCV_4809111 [Trichonephila clavipes]